MDNDGVKIMGEDTSKNQALLYRQFSTVLA